jgi:hypothetical protein
MQARVVISCLTVTFALLVGACSSSGPDDGAGDDTEVVDPDGKADGTTKPIGTYVLDPASPAGDLARLVLDGQNNVNGTFASPCEGCAGGDFYGTYKFTRSTSSSKRYIRIEAEDGVLRYEYKMSEGKLLLRVVSQWGVNLDASSWFSMIKPASGAGFSYGDLGIDAHWTTDPIPKIEARVSRKDSSFTAPCVLQAYLPNFDQVLDTRIFCELGDSFSDGLGFSITRIRKGGDITYKLLGVSLKKATYAEEYEILRGQPAAEGDNWQPALSATVGTDPALDPMALGALLEDALGTIQGQPLGGHTIREVDYVMNPTRAIAVTLDFGWGSKLELPTPIALTQDGKFLTPDAIRASVLEQANGGGPAGDLVLLEQAVSDAYRDGTLVEIDSNALPDWPKAFYEQTSSSASAGTTLTAYRLDAAALGTFFIVDVMNDVGASDVYVFDHDGACVLQGSSGESSGLAFKSGACVLPGE